MSYLWSLFVALQLGIRGRGWGVREEFVELRGSVVPANLLLVHHSHGQGLLCHLTIIDLLFHGALEERRKGIKLGRISYLANFTRIYFRFSDMV